jgi:pSer/pThr/pTyr-binding forkhead associated (FHA) protein
MNAELVVRRGDGTLQKVVVGDDLRIGSSPNDDVRPLGDGVAASHLRIRRSNGEHIVDADRGPTILINGIRVERCTLRHLDVITLAPDVDLIYTVAAAAPPPAPPPARRLDTVQTIRANADSLRLPDNMREAVGGAATPASTSRVPMVTEMPTVVADRRALGLPPPLRGDRETSPPLITGVILTGANGAYRIGLGRRSVGRSDTADLRIDSREVSRTHAWLTVSSTQVSVEDNQSSNGTAVNGTPITQSRQLVDGDLVAFATFEFKVEVTLGS